MAMYSETGFYRGSGGNIVNMAVNMVINNYNYNNSDEG
jgi:hypothetical protein